MGKGAKINKTGTFGKIVKAAGTPVRLLLSVPIIIWRRLISPVLPNSCLYTPSCSRYALEAMKKHGVAGGLILAFTRVTRCTGGLFTGGDDPVPDQFSFRYIGESYKKFRRRREKKEG